MLYEGTKSEKAMQEAMVHEEFLRADGASSIARGTRTDARASRPRLGRHHRVSERRAVAGMREFMEKALDRLDFRFVVIGLLQVLGEITHVIAAWA